jgi:hypothetical protein
VIQQRGGVSPEGGVGRAGDAHERAADAVAERVVRGESVAALLPAPRGRARPAVQRQDSEPAQAEELWHSVLESYEQEAADLPVGPARAEARRIYVLLSMGPEQLFDTRQHVEGFIAACEQTGRDEAATLTQLARYFTRESLLLDYGDAFPDTWAERIYRELHWDYDIPRLQSDWTAARGNSLALAPTLSDEIWDAGLPLTASEAARFTWDDLAHAAHSVKWARDGASDPVKHYVRSLYLWELAAAHYFAVHLHEAALLDHQAKLRSGTEVVDRDYYKGIRTAERFFLARREAFELASLRGDVGQMAFAIGLQESKVVQRDGRGQWLDFNAASEGMSAFWKEIKEVNELIRTAPAYGAMWRAGVWAYERGYFGTAAREVWEGLKDDWAKLLGTMLGILLLQAIPGVDVAVDIVLIIEFGLDILVTAAELADVLIDAGKAKTILEVQAASVRLARTLVGSAAKLALWAITWGVGKGVKKLGKWRAGKKFVDENSHTPEARAEAREELAKAKGDVEQASRALERKREFERQRAELAEADRQQKLREAERQKQAEAERQQKAEREAEQRRQEEEAHARLVAAEEALRAKLEVAGLPRDYTKHLNLKQLEEVDRALGRWNLDGTGKNQGVTHIIDYAKGLGAPGKDARLEQLERYLGKPGEFDINDPAVIPRVTDELDRLVADAVSKPAENRVRTPKPDKKIYFVPQVGKAPPFSNSAKGIIIITYMDRFATFMGSNWKGFTTMDTKP